MVKSPTYLTQMTIPYTYQAQNSYEYQSSSIATYSSVAQKE